MGGAEPRILRASAGAEIGDRRNLAGDSGFARPVSNADFPISGIRQGGGRRRFAFELRRYGGRWRPRKADAIRALLRSKLTARGVDRETRMIACAIGIVICRLPSLTLMVRYASSMTIALSRSSLRAGRLLRAPLGRPLELPDSPGLNREAAGGLR
jgi:hypothetical protein